MLFLDVEKSEAPASTCLATICIKQIFASLNNHQGGYRAKLQEAFLFTISKTMAFEEMFEKDLQIHQKQASSEFHKVLILSSG
jgi:hypothetical protein